MTDRISRLARTLADLDVDALLVVNETNVRYLSGFTGDSSWLLILPDGASTILSDGRYQVQLAQECPALPAAIRPPGQKIGELFAEVASSQSLARMGIEAGHVSIAMLRDWEEKLPDMTWVETNGVVENLRDQGRLRNCHDSASDCDRPTGFSQSHGGLQADQNRTGHSLRARGHDAAARR